MSVSEAKRVLAVEAEGLRAVHDRLGLEFEHPGGTDGAAG